MEVFRISKQEYAAIDGIGGLFFSGRWHKVGNKVVYTAQHRSLAALEYLAHLSIAQLLETGFILSTIYIPDELAVKTVAINNLGNNWAKLENSSQTQKLGTSFLMAAEYAILQVPSAIVTQEYNYILNPMHKEFEKCKIIDQQVFHFDGRLAKP